MQFEALLVVVTSFGASYLRFEVPLITLFNWEPRITIDILLSYLLVWVRLVSLLVYGLERTVQGKGKALDGRRSCAHTMRDYLSVCSEYRHPCGNEDANVHVC